jgi:hypothetical protein
MKALFENRILAGILGAIGCVGLGLSAYFSGDKFSIVLLTVFSLMWIFFAVNNSRGWHRALAHWRHTLLTWDDQQKMTTDMSNLLTEALQELTHYDHEKAADIADRAQTITMLRLQTFQEREIP